MTAAAMTERQLIDALRGGDEQAFTHLVSRHHGAMLRVARNYVGCSAVAEEVVQETWLGVVNGIGGFRGGSSLKTWIFRILINRAMSRGKREKRIVPFSSLAPDNEDFTPDTFLADGHWATPPRPFEAPADRMALIEFRARLREALVYLPERQQIVVTLRDVEGLSSDEVCDLLHISAENQRVLLHRGRTRLRQALESYENDELLTEA
ncbi:MAG TPA: sigma-70 family RNA polymerase sigma factor [Solirubrobacteraceae bacterium]|nr:sigma-70 family RNA polymerase sigma factor [Solirubrobacteraceae bacterium]